MCLFFGLLLFGPRIAGRDLVDLRVAALGRHVRQRHRCRSWALLFLPAAWQVLSRMDTAVPADYVRSGRLVCECGADLFRRYHFKVTLSAAVARPRQTDVLAAMAYVRGPEGIIVSLAERIG